MKLCKYSDPDYKDVIGALVNRSNKDLFVQDETVRKILNGVKEKGDAEVLRLTHQFDRHTLPLEKIRVTSEEIKAAYNGLNPEELDAFWECFQPPLYAGACDAEFEQCNIAFGSR